ncbi:MAG: hypothetical protein U0797_15250 [Gemmataceae bacterium]
MFWRWLLGRTQNSLPKARQEFARRRAGLEREFFAAASASGKPRGLRWKSIDWQPGVELARERKTRRLAALVGVTIAFEAVEGGEMEGVAAVGNLRVGSAVFFWHDGAWRTTGRVVLNLLPEEALARLGEEYERVSGPA